MSFICLFSVYNSQCDETTESINFKVKNRFSNNLLSFNKSNEKKTRSDFKLFNSNMSSFHGKIKEIPGVSVDNFEGHTRKSRAYFLSHCHSDHIQGLKTLEFFKNVTEANAKIYMSFPTKIIIQDELGDNFAHIAQCVVPLKMGWQHIILPATTEWEELLLHVAVISAGHCLGSCMFLFKTNAKTVLYTGDFRFGINDVPKISLLHDKSMNPTNIDSLYIDTTFIDKRYFQFPKRSDSIDVVIKEMKKWCDVNKNNMIALHTSAKYGYEFVFNTIYSKLNMKVQVDSSRWRVYSSLGGLVPSVTCDEKTRIHVCRNRAEGSSHEKCLPKGKLNGKEKFLYIHVSALKWQHFDEEEQPIIVLPNRIDVCFATHCSRSEIINFVSYFNPKSVIGFPNSYLVEDVKVASLKRKQSPQKLEFTSKKIIQDRKVDCKLLSDMFG